MPRHRKADRTAAPGKEKEVKDAFFLVKVAGMTPACKASLAPDRAAVLWTISDGLKL